MTEERASNPGACRQTPPTTDSAAVAAKAIAAPAHVVRAGVAAANPLAVYMHPEDIPRIVAVVQNLPPAQPTTYEFRIRTKGGAERWIQSTAQAIQDPGGQFLRLYGAARDITEQKQREADIVESRRLRDRMAETMPDIVYTYDLDRRAFVYVNRQLFTILGYQPEQVLHRTDALFRDRVHGADVEKVRERDARLATAADPTGAILKHVDPNTQTPPES